MSAARPCPCGCGKAVTNAFQECLPVLPWDDLFAPLRTKDERCANHPLCAYRDDDPRRCPACHGAANCTCVPAWVPPKAPRKGKK